MNRIRYAACDVGDFSRLFASHTYICMIPMYWVRIEQYRVYGQSKANNPQH